MTIAGTIHNGVVVFDSPPPVQEGTRVQVTIDDESATPTLAERLKGVIGRAVGLPADAAAQHDHYLYGGRSTHAPAGRR